MIDYYGITKDFSIDGKAAIITGGAAGIGYATARFFAEKGANLVLADINPDVDAAAKKLGARNVGVSGDILDAVSRAAIVRAAAEAFGGADILVNSAGIAALDNAETLSEEMWDRTLDINLKGSFLMAQAVGKWMIENKRRGSIVNIASQAGVVALDRHVAYCASKGGVISMTKVLALEWGRHGIRVNAVSPTVVLTELGRRAWDGPVGDEFKKEIPAGRFAEPDEIAAVIAFLSGDSAAMITGHNLVIDGGYTIR